MKTVKIALIMLIALLASALIALRVTYGGGEYYPDLSTPPAIPNDSLEVFFEFEEPLGNIAVSSGNRVFFTIHPESRPDQNRLMEIINGKATHYPNREVQKEYFQTVLGLMIDQQNRLWTIDHGFHGLGSTRLLAFDLSTDELVYDHTFNSQIAQEGSFFNDLQVSNDGRYIYITDVSFFRKNPALIVHDTETSTSKRLLENQVSVSAQDWIIQTSIKDMVFFGLVALKPGIDGIALDTSGEYIYYGTMAHDKLYKVSTKLLHESHYITDNDVEIVGNKPMSDGLTIDSVGNIYITDVEHNGIAKLNQKGSLTTQIKDDRIRWADGLSFGGDGYLYFTDSAIPDQMIRSKSHIEASAPYQIFRYRPETGGVPGR